MASEQTTTVTVDRDAFAAVLKAVQRVADPRTGVRLLADESGLRLDTTDLNRYVTAQIPAEVRAPGATVVSAKALADLVGKLPKGRVELALGEDRRPVFLQGEPVAHVKAWFGRHPLPAPLLTVGAGTVSFQLPTFRARDWPKVPAAPALHAVNGPALRDMLERVAPTISTDETRHHLSGALLCAEGGDFLAVSTDGHRLTLVRRARAAHALPRLDRMLVPRAAVLEMIQLLRAAKGEPVSFGAEKGHAFLVAGGVTLCAKLADAQFPPYQQVIPRDHEREVAVERAALLTALDQALLVAAERTCGITLGLNHGALRVRADDPDRGQFAADLPARYAGAPFVWGVNGHYLRDALKASSGPLVTIQLNGSHDPCKIPDGAGGVHVIMPCRMDGGEVRADHPAIPPAAETLPTFAPAPARAARPARGKAAPAPAAPLAFDDTELRALCAELAGCPLDNLQACLAWLRQEVEEARRLKEAQKSAPAGPRLVYSAPPKTPALRQPQRRAPARVAAKRVTATATAKAPQPRRQAETWDW